jgi:hypothetical protein
MKVFYFSTAAMAQLNYDNFSPFVGNSYAYDDAEMFEGFGSAATVAKDSKITLSFLKSSSFSKEDKLSR